MKLEVDKNEELDRKHEILKGLCSRCHGIRTLRFDSKGHLKCKECGSLYVEVLFKEIQ
jgi:tRNA(Ile2) C34 agmatinyltransferase TiaS